MLDHHDRRLGHVDADFDDGGGDQNLGLAALKARHRRVLLGAFHATVDQADRVAKEAAQGFGTLLRRRDVEFFALFDQRADPIGPRAMLKRPPDPGDDLFQPLQRHGARVYGRAARRLFVELRGVHVAEIGQHQGARDRRRGHDEKIDGVALAAKGEALVHAEAMLLVDDG